MAERVEEAVQVVYRVKYETQYNDEDEWMVDCKLVVAGPDALEAVDKVRAHEAEPWTGDDENGVPIVQTMTAFRLIEVKAECHIDL